MSHSCQNGRETAVISGHSRTPRTASDLGMGWLTRCVKHTSKQSVERSWQGGGRYSSDTYVSDWPTSRLRPTNRLQSLLATQEQSLMYQASPNGLLDK
jgi:hypothetical protein